MYKYGKKIIFFLVIISPLLYILFVGYPIKKAVPSPGQSARCFKVGELREFIECYREGRQLRGVEFVKDIVHKTSSFHPFAGVLFLVFSVIHLLLILALLF